MQSVLGGSVNIVCVLRVRSRGEGREAGGGQRRKRGGASTATALGKCQFFRLSRVERAKENNASAVLRRGWLVWFLIGKERC